MVTCFTQNMTEWRVWNTNCKKGQVSTTGISQEHRSVFHKTALKYQK